MGTFRAQGTRLHVSAIEAEIMCVATPSGAVPRVSQVRLELEAESRLVIDDRRPGTELDSGKCAWRPGVRTGHEAQHRPVRVGDVHRNPEVSAVIDVAMFNTELDAAIDHGRHLPRRPEHEGTHIEAVQIRTARTIFTLAEPDHEPRFVIGEDDTSDCTVLEELVGQFQIEEICVPSGADSQVTHRQLDLGDANDGQLHNSSVSKRRRPRGIAHIGGRRPVEHRGLETGAAKARTELSFAKT